MANVDPTSVGRVQADRIARHAKKHRKWAFTSVADADTWTSNLPGLTGHLSPHSTIGRAGCSDWNAKALGSLLRSERDGVQFHR